MFPPTGETSCNVQIKLPKVTYYAKMSCTNQSGLLSGVYNQVVTVPYLSDQRNQRFEDPFFEHIEKKKIMTATRKTIPQIINILTSTLEELHEGRKANGRIEMGTTYWREMSSLQLGTQDAEVQIA